MERSTVMLRVMDAAAVRTELNDVVAEHGPGPRTISTSVKASKTLEEPTSLVGDHDRRLLWTSLCNRRGVPAHCGFLLRAR
jgi:hypothetical protein